MKKCYLVLLVLFFSASAWAQDVQVTGTITDNTGFGLPGVNVIEKGTSNGTSSAIDGKYAISVTSSDAVLVFSFIGFTAKEITVADLKTINVVLEEDAIGLDEVVAVGYGVQKKVNLTGSVEVVKSEEITKQSVAQTSQALVGLSPGLTAIQKSGQPGDDGADLVIRGLGSFEASSSPLVLIDGIEGSINGIDANDIESISVLKDAGSSAIYGSRASNGVILITTKRAKAGKVSVLYNGYMSFNNPTNQPEFASAIEYLEATGDDVKLQEYLDNPNDTDHYPDTDWVDLLFSESGFAQYHSIDISGGSEAARVKATLSYLDQDGNIPSYGYKRYQGRVNSDFKISDKLKVSVDLNFRQGITTAAPSGNGVEKVYRQPSIFPAIYSYGRYAFPQTGGNAIAEVNLSGQKTVESNYFRSVIKAVYEPIKDLTFSATYSPEFAETYTKNFRPQYEVFENPDSDTPSIQSSGTNKEAELSQKNERFFTDNFTAIAQYSKDFSNHHFELLGGYEFIKYRTENFEASRYGYIIQDFDILNNGNADNDSNAGSADHNGLVSYFGRLNYSFDNRYLFGFNIRRDGSSRFAEENRFGYFPSFSAGWKLHNESFFPQDIFLNRVKVRGSWGQLGNQSIGKSFPYTSLISIGSSHYANGAIQQGAAQATMSNRAISWETGETFNIGVDLGMFDNRLTSTIEYYVRKTNDLLGKQNISGAIGLDSPFANVFSMENRGFDISVAWRDQIKDLKYHVNANLSTLTNEITDLNGIEFIKGGADIKQVGQPINSIYGYESLGMFANQDEIAAAPSQFGTLTPGDIRYKDQLTVDTDGDGVLDAGDGVINEEDKVILGNSFPGLSFGLNLGLDYKGFDLSVALQGVTDREVYLKRYLVQPLFNAGNITKWQLNESWTPEKLDARYPVVKPYSGGSNNSKVNSTYVFDASYLRVRNITLGYTLPKNVVEKISLGSVRFYASGQNLLTFDKMPEGIDPLIPNGSQGSVYPVLKTYTFGVNVSF